MILKPIDNKQPQYSMTAMTKWNLLTTIKFIIKQKLIYIYRWVFVLW
jgi:hypothetical protein